jgi:hypothetical protein
MLPLATSWAHTLRNLGGLPQIKAKAIRPRSLAGKSQKGKAMSDLKVRVFKGNQQKPATTVTVPGGILKIASNLIPNKAVAALKEQGMDLDEIVRLSEAPDATGKLVEVEDHEKNERVVISLE